MRAPPPLHERRSLSGQPATACTGPLVVRHCSGCVGVPMVRFQTNLAARMVLETLSFLAIFIIALLRIERWMLARHVREQAELAVAAKQVQARLDAAVPVD